MAEKTQHGNVCDKKQEGGNGSEDRISQCLDDICVSILSRLPMEQAARTSVVSKRWRFTWTYTTNLNFDSLQLLRSLKEERSQSLQVERSKYVSRVNQVLRSHQGSTIDEFRVRFDLNKCYRDQIDSWVNFAMQKRVKRLELFLPSCMGLRLEENSYDFPHMGPTARSLHSRPLVFSNCYSLTDLNLRYVEVNGEVLEYFLCSCPVLERLCVDSSHSLRNLKVAGPSLPLKYLAIHCCFNLESLEIYAQNLVSFEYSGPKIDHPFKDTPCLAEISIGWQYYEYLIFNIVQDLEMYKFSNSLTVLNLSFVDVNGEVLEYILCSCPVLEQLCVNSSRSLRKLKVAGPSLPLKYLEISCCSQFRLEIYAQNLVSFKYCGKKIDHPFKDTPCLAKISIGGQYCEYLIYNGLGQIPTSLPRLEKLVLYLDIYKEGMDSLEFPRLNSLKQLELSIAATDYQTLLGFTALLEASPFLYKFTLKLKHAPREVPREVQKKAATCPHQHLKVVEIVGFRGLGIDVELAMYCIENAPMLEKLVLDCRYPMIMRPPGFFDDAAEEQAARNGAARLAAELRPGVKLVFI